MTRDSLDVLQSSGHGIRDHRPILTRLTNSSKLGHATAPELFSSGFRAQMKGKFLHLISVSVRRLFMKMRVWKTGGDEEVHSVTVSLCVLDRLNL